MKITTEYLQPLEGEQETRTRRTESGEGFGELLSRELGAQEGVAAAGLQPPAAPLLPHQIAAAQGAAAVDESATTGQGVMDTLENIMGEWENYASQIAGSGSGDALRKADGALTSIENDVAGLKSSYPDLGDDDPGLKSVVDEMEILAVTERIKFNRGDYL